jgi:hypothetical protein
VKVNNILTMMGTGVVLGLTGGILIVSSAALGLHAAFADYLPQWAAFLIVGVVTAGAGGFLLSRSGTETSKKIEKVEQKLTLQEAWKNKPWLMLGVSVAVGFLGQRLLRSVFASDTRRVEIYPEPEALYERQEREEPPPRKRHSNFKDFLFRPFVELTRSAASRAISTGAQMVILPLLMKKLQEYLDQHQMNFAKKQEEYERPNGAPRDDYSQSQANGTRRF